jgi:hypothetical protein
MSSKSKNVQIEDDQTIGIVYGNSEFNFTISSETWNYKVNLFCFSNNYIIYYVIIQIFIIFNI